MKLKTTQYFLIIFAAILGASIIFTELDPISKVLSDKSPSARVNVLVMGMDAVSGARHTDTLMLLSYSPSERILNILSIPRDTVVNYEGRARRINEIYSIILARKKRSAHFEETSGRVSPRPISPRHIEKSAARDFLEFVNAAILQGAAEVRYYVQVDYGFFEGLVDNLTGGKIKVEISEPMKYDDFAGGLHINFSTGVHYLNGKDALKYIRYRGKGSDIKRIARQQQFVVDWISSIKKPLVFWRLPFLATSFYKNVNSNISKWALINFALIEFRDFDTSNVRFFSLPGRMGGNYWIYNASDARQRNFFKIMTGADLSSENSGRDTSAPPLLPREVSKNDGRTFTVEIWNASGIPGAARVTRDILISAGFNVVDWGNYPSVRQEKTLIKNLSEDGSVGAMVRDCLRFGEVVNKYETNRNVDIVVIIGKDYIAP